MFPTHKLILTAFAGCLFACGGRTTMQVKTGVSASAMTQAGCTDLSEAPDAYMMKCPDGSKFFWSSANPDVVMCEGEASSEEACRAAIKTYGGEAGITLD